MGSQNVDQACKRLVRYGDSWPNLYSAAFVEGLEKGVVGLGESFKL